MDTLRYAVELIQWPSTTCTAQEGIGVGRYADAGDGSNPSNSTRRAPFEGAARIAGHPAAKVLDAAALPQGAAYFICRKENPVELSELKDKILFIFNASVENIEDKIMETLLNPDKNAFESYLNAVDNDLQTDYLQKIWQYYRADRKGKCQDYTPKSLAKLCSKLTENGGKVCYDLCAGSGALTIQKWAQNNDKTFICEELDKNVFPILLFNMAVRNMNGYALCRDALSSEFYFGYKLEKGKKFSSLSKIDTPPEIKADEIVSNPPFNIKWDSPAPLFADSRFQKCDIPPASNANWAFVLTALDRLSNFGKCAFILPCGFLSKDNEREQRKWATKNNLLKKVIMVPDSMFESTGIPTCVLLFENNSRGIEFFDARKCGIKEERLQKGQFGGTSHQNRIYKKEVAILQDEEINKLLKYSEDIPDFSTKKSKDEIESNQWEWNPGRYIYRCQEKLFHRNYKDIMDDINRISRERASVKVTINETLARQLGLYEVAEIEKKADTTGLSQTFNLLGGEYTSKSYITLSKNKNEIKFESNDKEILSSLFSILLPMWKQHIFYLNQQENMLLAELRDAMLPDLMSGKLSIEKDE